MVEAEIQPSLTLNPMPHSSELLKKCIKFKGRTHYLETLENKMLYFMHTVGDLSFLLEGKNQWLYIIWLDTHY